MQLSVNGTDLSECRVLVIYLQSSKHTDEGLYTLTSIYGTTPVGLMKWISLEYPMFLSSTLQPTISLHKRLCLTASQISAHGADITNSPRCQLQSGFETVSPSHPTYSESTSPFPAGEFLFIW